MTTLFYLWSSYRYEDCEDTQSDVRFKKPSWYTERLLGGVEISFRTTEPRYTLHARHQCSRRNRPDEQGCDRLIPKGKMRIPGPAV